MSERLTLIPSPSTSAWTRRRVNAPAVIGSVIFNDLRKICAMPPLRGPASRIGGVDASAKRISNPISDRGGESCCRLEPFAGALSVRSSEIPVDNNASELQNREQD